MAGKKVRRHGLKTKAVEVERGFIVVSAKTGRRVYLGHPEGVSEEEAKKLSDGLLAETKVVPFNEVSWTH